MLSGGRGEEQDSALSLETRLDRRMQLYQFIIPKAVDITAVCKLFIGVLSIGLSMFGNRKVSGIVVSDMNM